MLSKQKSLSISIAVIFALLASSLPLTSYVLSLSLFGLPHIYCELKYINDRFSDRFNQQFKIMVLSILCIICINSLIALIHPDSFYLEISLCLILMLVVLSYCYAPSLVCLSFLLLLIVGIILNPILVLFTMAFLHNLTPWGFLKELRANTHSIIVFIVFPILVFMLSALFALDFNFYSPTNASNYLSHYIPRQLQEIDWLKSLFASAVYLQLIHYDATIRVLPTFMQNRLKLNWTLLVLFAGVFIAFMMNFTFSRAYYSIFATFHAWLEVPILLIMLQSNSLKIKYRFMA